MTQIAYVIDLFICTLQLVKTIERGKAENIIIFVRKQSNKKATKEKKELKSKREREREKRMKTRKKTQKEKK